MVTTKKTQRPETGPKYTIQHPAGHAAGPNMTEMETRGHRRFGHLAHHVPQVSKHKDYPDGTPAIDYTNRKAATDGKYDINTDGHDKWDSDAHGWNVDGETLSKSTSVSMPGNKIRAMVLSPFPELGSEVDHADPPRMGSKVKVLHDCIIDTIHAHTMEYKQPTRI